jgi:two-component system, cell cycle sensor histidine kinase and response regulator CckA
MSRAFAVNDKAMQHELEIGESDRQRAEMEVTLRATMDEVVAGESRYIDLIESLPNGIVAADENGTIALVNARTERMFGYSRGELIGRPFGILFTDEGNGGPAEAHRFDLRGRRKNGTEFPLEIGSSVARNERGTLVTSVLTDITQRKQLEHQLQQAQKMEAVGRLAGGVAHDFNNLLQVIGGYADALRSHLTDGEDAQQLEEIAAAADRGSALTRQLLAFSRRQVLEPTTLDLNRIVRDMQRMLGRMIGADVALSIDLEPELGAVLADHAQLEQVLANLALNARDAMPSGGRLSISTRNVELKSAVESLDLEPGKYVRLSVTDTGHGMDAATVARALEPFFTTKPESHGTGLGLAMVHGIVTQSGGGLRILSEPGEGTTVSISFPRAPAGAAELPVGVQAPPATGGPERVLLVEDEVAVRRLLGEMLSELGYDVVAADCGAAAIERFAEGSFDVVVTDFIMPGMTGRELVDRLANLGADPLVLFVSGYAPDSGLENARGRESFLQKPFTSDELARRLRILLDSASVTT